MVFVHVFNTFITTLHYGPDAALGTGGVAVSKGKVRAPVELTFHVGREQVKTKGREEVAQAKKERKQVGGAGYKGTGEGVLPWRHLSRDLETAREACG